MKGFIVGLIVLGGVCLVGGAAVLAYGMSKGSINNNYETNEHKFDEDIDSIEIDAGRADVEIKKAEDDQTKVVCVEKEKVYHITTVSNKVLKIEERDDRKWYQKYLFDWDWKSMKVTVYLPETAYNDIKVDSNTGDIAFDKNFTFVNMDLSSDTGTIKVNNKCTGNIDINVHTGGVYLTDVNANSVKVKSSTGDITIKNGEVTEGIELNSSTGDLELTEVETKSLKAKASTGHVYLTDMVASEKVEIKTSTGAVKFNRSDSKDIKVETSTGSIKGTLLTSKIFNAKSDTGHVRLPDTKDWNQEGGVFEAKSDTGSIEISIA